MTDRLASRIMWGSIVWFFVAFLMLFIGTVYAADPALELLETKLQLANTQLQVLQLQFTQIQQEQIRLTAEIEKKKAEAKATAPVPTVPESTTTK